MIKFEKRNYQISLYGLCLSALVLLYCLKNIYIIAQSIFAITIINAIEWIFYGVLIVILVHRKTYKVKELFCFVIIGLLLLIVYVSSGYAALLKAFVIMISAKGVDFRKIVSIIKTTYIVAFILTVILFILGISDSGVQRRGYSALGFTNTNVCGGVILIICLLWMLSKEKISWRECFVIWTVGIAQIFIINNRSILLLLLIAPILAIILKRSKVVSILIYVFPLLCVALSLLTAYMYPNSSLIQNLDVLTSHRIYLNYYNIDINGIRLFGQHIQFHDSKNIFNSVTGQYSSFNTVDNSYVCLLIQMGGVSTFLYFLSHVLLVKKIFNEKNYTLLSAMIVLGVYGLFEASLLEVYINIPFIYLFSVSSSGTLSLHFAKVSDTTQLPNNSDDLKFE